MALRRNNILVINPPIYDFAAYDLYSKPLGLLYIASILRQAGANISLLDCLDRYHPAMTARYAPRATRPNATGKYHRRTIDTPACLQHVPRPYHRYGMPPDLVDELLQQQSRTAPPAAVLVTSMMTYWYPAVADIIAQVRHWLPGVPIALGGIYAGLMPQHAQRVCQPDRVFTGSDLDPLFTWLTEIDALPHKPADFDSTDFNTWPAPAYDLYHHSLPYLAVMTGLGCPFCCDYCASRTLQPHLSQIAPDRFVQHIDTMLSSAEPYEGHFHIAFYDDALLYRAEEHFVPILAQLHQRQQRHHPNHPLTYYCPNGLHLRYITPSVAHAMYRFGVKMLRLSYEASSETSLAQRSSSDKVNDSIFHQALDNLLHAGYRPADLEAYILTGLPGQSYDEIQASARAVHARGLKIRLCQFTPIPHSKLFSHTCDHYDLDPNEPLLHNNSILPIIGAQLGFERFQAFKGFVQRLNRALPINK